MVILKIAVVRNLDKRQKRIVTKVVVKIGKSVVSTMGKLITIIMASIIAIDITSIADSSFVVVMFVEVACIAKLAIAVLIFQTSIAIYP
jgi:ATP/ADP translocase